MKCSSTEFFKLLQLQCFFCLPSVEQNQELSEDDITMSAARKNKEEKKKSVISVVGRIST